MQRTTFFVRAPSRYRLPVEGGPEPLRAGVKPAALEVADRDRVVAVRVAPEAAGIRGAGLLVGVRRAGDAGAAVRDVRAAATSTRPAATASTARARAAITAA